GGIEAASECRHSSISARAKTKRGFAIAASLAGTFRFYQRRRHSLDCGQAGVTADQRSGVGNLLSDVAAKTHWQNPYSRLSDTDLCNGWELSCHGKPLRDCRHYRQTRWCS